MYTIQMNGPAKNALGTEMMRWIQAELHAADGQPVLLTGTEDAFSAGLNLKELSTVDAAGMRAFLETLEETVHALFHHPAPTAAAVNGHAIAGGCVLELCCDVRVATSNPRARIGLNEVALGLVFPPRTLEMVHYRLHPGHAETVLLGAGLHAPSESLRLGLVDAIADDPVAEATSRLQALARHPAAAYRTAKQTLREGIGDLDEDVQSRFLEQVLPVWTGDELRARIDAFLNRK